MLGIQSLIMKVITDFIINMYDRELRLTISHLFIGNTLQFKGKLNRDETIRSLLRSEGGSY